MLIYALSYVELFPLSLSVKVQCSLNSWYRSGRRAVDSKVRWASQDLTLARNQAVVTSHAQLWSLQARDWSIEREVNYKAFSHVSHSLTSRECQTGKVTTLPLYSNSQSTVIRPDGELARLWCYIEHFWLWFYAQSGQSCYVCTPCWIEHKTHTTVLSTCQQARLV